MRFIFAAAFAACLATQATAAQFKILIATWRGCEEACNGFQDYLNEAGIDIDFLIRNAGRDPSKLPDFIAEARAEQVDLILTWGTSVTRGISGTLEDLDDPNIPHEIPRVFTVVADPDRRPHRRKLRSYRAQECRRHLQQGARAGEYRNHPPLSPQLQPSGPCCTTGTRRTRSSSMRRWPRCPGI